MGTQMLQRRGTSAEWAAANTILGDGEFGFDKTTGEVRMGDGVTAWNALPTSKIFIPRATLNTLYSPIGAIPASLVDAAGDLLVGSADNTVVRLGKGANGQYLSVVAGALAWSNLPVVANPYAVVTTAEDLIVGSGNGTVKRVGSGAEGQVLTVVGGVLTWATPSSVDSSKLAKAGDTMTGLLKTASLGVDVSSLELQGASGVGVAASAAMQFDGPGVSHGGIGYHPGQSGFQFRTTGSNYANGSANAAIRAGAIYDSGNRVYSASNPPPASGMTVLAGATTQPVGTGTATGVTFVAPATGRVVIRLSAHSSTMYSGSNQDALSIDNSTWTVAAETASISTAGYLVPRVGSAVYTGLTPGATYTVYMKCTSYTAQSFSYSVEG